MNSDEEGRRKKKKKNKEMSVNSIIAVVVRKFVRGEAIIMSSVNFTSKKMR